MSPNYLYLPSLYLHSLVSIADRQFVIEICLHSTYFPIQPTLQFSPVFGVLPILQYFSAISKTLSWNCFLYRCCASQNQEETPSIRDRKTTKKMIFQSSVILGVCKLITFLLREFFSVCKL